METARWAYHGTSARALVQIKKRGLRPDADNVLFFSDDPYGAEAHANKHKNGVVLRFPWPDDAELENEDDYGWNELVTASDISPDEIDVWRAGRIGWEPIK